jgi:hypothetical protein
MQNRVPVVRAEADKAALTGFAPVPRLKKRHDGWTAERQRAFIAALADTGSVTRAAGIVNMAQTNCYTLRRAPGAESFAAAWDAALDFGLARLKDIAFERAINGQLVPRFAGGKLVGFQRKRNDALLMFCLRHYGRDASGQRRTVDQFRARATARGDGAEVEVSVEGAHPRSALPSRPSQKEGTLETFEGVELDEAARREIEAALVACAGRRRMLDEQWHGTADERRAAIAADPDTNFLQIGKRVTYHDAFADPYPLASDEPGDAPFRAGEPHWTELGATAEVKRRRRRSS